jgi:hypothetical protein
MSTPCAVKLPNTYWDVLKKIAASKKFSLHYPDVTAFLCKALTKEIERFKIEGTVPNIKITYPVKQNIVRLSVDLWLNARYITFLPHGYKYLYKFTTIAVRAELERIQQEINISGDFNLLTDEQKLEAALYDDIAKVLL